MKIRIFAIILVFVFLLFYLLLERATVVIYDRLTFSSDPSNPSSVIHLEVGYDL